LANYYGGERVYHHTAPISAIYGLAEGLRVVAEEGLEKRYHRHASTARELIAGLAPLGFEPLVEAEHRLPMLTTVRLPDSVTERGEAKVRRALLDRHDIEVGAGLGALAGRVWRIGLMGENARSECVDRLLEALRAELG
jgi:alanine-glyoxylate transaminase/serine-glyoxylate transaminase/serine-pyruvate transaminase